MPVTGDAKLEFTAAGELKSAKLALALSRGQIRLPALAGAPLTVDGGQFLFDYDAQARRLALAPSTLQWGDSRMTLEGSISGATGRDGDEWGFKLSAKEGLLAAEEFGVAGIAVDAFVAGGRLVPSRGLIELAEFSLAAGGAKVSANGEVMTGAATPSTRIDATMSPMSLPTLKALWPRAVTPAARKWVGQHLTRGTLKSGTFRLLTGDFLKNADVSPGRTERLSLVIEGGDLEMVPFPDGFPVVAPQATLRLVDDTFEVSVPEAALLVSPTRQVPLKGGRFAIASVSSSFPLAELSFRSDTQLAALLEAVNRSRLPLAEFGSLPVEGIDGRVEGEFKVTMPLIPGTGAAVKTEGKARISEIKSKGRVGPYELQGGTIDVDVSEAAVSANGELLFNGVLAKLNLQHIFEAPDDTQLPLRITARLDNSDRNQLELDVNHLVQGEVPVEVSITRGADGKPQVHAQADLTNAELILYGVAWRKPQGRPASLEFDLVQAEPQGFSLENFKVQGDNIAIGGRVGLDARNHVREFAFPDFSLNVVSRLDVQGEINPQRIWVMKAKGSTFDATDLFRRFLALGQSGETEIKPRYPAEGMDFEAEIDTVLGNGGTTLRGLKMKLTQKGYDIASLDARGTLEGNKPLALLLKRNASGERVVYADSTDAGRAFKLVGFYPNMEGGRVRLELNLDGRGAAERTGILWVDDFKVLGDPIVAEVYSSATVKGTEIDTTPSGQRRVVREVFEFDHMKAPFSAGHGQFVLDESYIKGPLLGATIRGKVDFGARRVNLGGTYVPLQGINSAFCDIPLVGPLVSGLKCEGVFGLTYAIQGSMSDPQVIVNPLSMFTPGILRGIMEMTNPNPTVLPRGGAPKAPAEDRVRASSSGVAEGGNANQPMRSDTVDGWSSSTDSKPTKKN